MSELPAALELRLVKVKPLAPPFHQHIVRRQLQGRVVQAGDRVVVYEVTATDPEGPVIVTEATVLRFE
jgi:hypothetical protein